MFCMLAAFVFWLLNILNKPYRFEVQVPIVFKNVPVNQALTIANNRSVSFKVEGTGWYFLRSKLSQISDTLVLDLDKYEGKTEIDLTKSLVDLDIQLQSKLKIIEVFPAKLPFSFEKKSVKKVPIIAKVKLNFRNQFDQSASIKLYPDSVTISGPFERIKNITSWSTVPLVLNDLCLNYQEVIRLKDVDNSNVLLSFASTTIQIPVEKFTENILQIPIQMKGFIGDGVMKIFPKTCEVKYQVSLTNYNLIKPQSFRIIASKDPLLTDRLKLTLVESPAFIKNIRIFPQTVDYLIIK